MKLAGKKSQNSLTKSLFKNKKLETSKNETEKSRQTLLLFKRQKKIYVADINFDEFAFSKSWKWSFYLMSFVEFFLLTKIRNDSANWKKMVYRKKLTLIHSKNSFIIGLGKLKSISEDYRVTERYVTQWKHQIGKKIVLYG